MIILIGTIRIPKDKQAEALPALEAHMKATRLEPGNLAFEIEPDALDAEIFHVYEEFVDEESFEAHQILGASRPWGLISQDFERDYRKTIQNK